jgi:hypothetical protein
MPKDNPKRGLPPPTVVKNRRLKISPGGIITLPVAARKALRMLKGQGARVTVSVSDGVVTLSSGETGGFRVSPGGQLELRSEARSVLDGGLERHYWIELEDARGEVRLRPYR